VQFVALRLALTAPMPGSFGRLALTPRGAAARKGARPVWFPEAGGFVETAVYNRYALRAGEAIEGPAVFEENESTFIIGPGGHATILDDGTIDVMVVS
jgi:N-methylhydantoinase A